MHTIELSAGPIEYEDTGGPGPVLVLTPGFPMTGTLWRAVLPHLSDYRCILPTLPLGAHRLPMRPDADLSQGGQARLLGELIERLGLRRVTMVMNDWGGPQLMINEGVADRVARLIFVACEAFDNFPPPPARPMVRLAKLPGGTRLLMRLLSTRLFRHHPKLYGVISRRGVPDDMLDEWFAPATASAEIRRDLAKFGTSAPDRATQLRWSESLRGFTGPALVVWAAEDAMMPADHGPRLAATLPNARLVVIDDSATLIPIDQPERLAEVLLTFLHETDDVATPSP